MKRYITKTISLSLFVALLPLAAVADPTPLPVNHNSAAAAQAELQAFTRSFVEQSYEMARLNSPFAAFDAPEAAPAPSLETPAEATRMLEYAARFLGTRYRYGSAGPGTFDCSGFTSYVFRHIGINLSRSSRDQYRQGSKVNVRDLKPGDLMFFSSPRSGRGNVGHVAIVASVDRENNTLQFIHASTRRGVTYQKFPDNGYYSRNYIGAKRVIE